MSYLHLFYTIVMALNISGKIAPARPKPLHASVSPVFHASKNNKKESAEVIPWSIDRRLEWDDFLCEPKKHTDAVASTSTSLGISYKIENGLLVYGITCDFSKTKSWGLLRTDYILAHEQGHFDITEIAARRLHQALQQYNFNRRTYRQDINEIYRTIVKEKEDLQATYDEASDHSRKRKMQYEWEEKIAMMLSQTEAFASYP